MSSDLSARLMDDESAHDVPVDSLRGESSGRAQRRSRLVIGGIIVAVIGLVAVLAIVPNPTSNGPANDASPVSEQAKDVRPIFREHPLFAGIKSVPVPVPGDDNVEHHSMHFDVVADDHHTHFHSEVDVYKDHVNLHEHEAALALDCNNTHVTVKFNSSSAAANFTASINANNTLMSILPEWGCAGGSLIRRAAIDGTTLNGTHVHVATYNATIENLFKNANITYNGTRTPGMVQTHKNGNGLNPLSKRTRRGFFHHLWHDVTSVVHHGFEDVVHGVEDVGRVVEAVVTGEVEYHKSPWTKSFSESKVCGSGTVGNDMSCNIGFELELLLVVNITNYHIRNFKLLGSANGHAHVQSNGQAIDDTWTGVTPTETLINDNLFSFTIPAGPIPIPFSVDLTMTSDFKWNVSGSFNFDGTVTAQGMAGFGFQCDPHCHELDPSSFSHTATTPSVTGEAEAQGTVVLTTRLSLKAAYSATVYSNLAVSPSVSVTASDTLTLPNAQEDYDNTQSVPAEGCVPIESSGDEDKYTPSLKLGLGVGVDLGVGAKVDLHLFKMQIWNHSWTMNVFNKLFAIGQWCFHP